MKAIDTSYNGYLFRSRLEARWAVFFDELGIRYEYEDQGYELSNGQWYLPDFWLPDLKTFVEVKPRKSASSLRPAMALLKQLTTDSGCDTWLVAGVPEYDSYWGYRKEPKEGAIAMDFVFTDDEYWKKENRLYVCSGHVPSDRHDWPLPYNAHGDEYVGRKFTRAAHAAKRARFEHGAHA